MYKFDVMALSYYHYSYKPLILIKSPGNMIITVRQLRNVRQRPMTKQFRI